MTAMSGHAIELAPHAATGTGEPHSRTLEHAFHCVDYLRQNIMCNGDTTVDREAQDVDQNGHSGHINGYGVPRQCRNWVRSISRRYVEFSCSRDVPAKRTNSDHGWSSGIHRTRSIKYNAETHGSSFCGMSF